MGRPVREGWQRPSGERRIYPAEPCHFLIRRTRTPPEELPKTPAKRTPLKSRFSEQPHRSDLAHLLLDSGLWTLDLGLWTLRFPAHAPADSLCLPTEDAASRGRGLC